MTAHTPILAPSLTTQLRAMLDGIAATDDEILSMADPRDRARLAALQLAAELYGDSDEGLVLAAMVTVIRRHNWVGKCLDEEAVEALESAVDDLEHAAGDMLAKLGSALAGYWRQAK